MLLRLRSSLEDISNNLLTEGQLPNYRIRTVDGCYTIRNTARTFDHARQSTGRYCIPLEEATSNVHADTQPLKAQLPREYDTSSSLSPIKHSSTIWPNVSKPGLSLLTFVMYRLFTNSWYRYIECIVFIEYLLRWLAK